MERFGYPLLLLETFVDPTRFNGTIYKAANWLFTGYTKGYRRTRTGYSNTVRNPKMVFIQPIQRSARNLLSCSKLNPRYQTGGPRMKLRAEHMNLSFACLDFGFISFGCNYPVFHFSPF
jgi:hypothetical protein